MSNPTFRTGDLTREAGALVEKFHLVKTVDGKVQHNDKGTFPVGAVTESAEPEGTPEDNVLNHGLPRFVRVQTSQRVVKIATKDDFTLDGDVFAADGGEVAKSGSVKVGVAASATEGGLVRVHLFHPSVLAGGTADNGGGAAEGE